MGGWAAGKSLSRLYLRNYKVLEVDTYWEHWLGVSRCVTSWCNLDLTLCLVVVTLSENFVLAIS